MCVKLYLMSALSVSMNMDFYKLIGYISQRWSSLVLHRASPDRILDIDITVTTSLPGASVGWFTETNSNITFGVILFVIFSFLWCGMVHPCKMSPQ